MKEKIAGLHLGKGFREWVFECEYDKTKPIHEQEVKCRPIVDAETPRVLKNGINIKTRKGEYGFDLIQLNDGTKLLYPNTDADFS